jgi:L-ribulose-5-phosphate 3-epimerase
MANHRLGIMQGRLSPVVDGQIQYFPVDTWEKEFALAAECGFEIMEWVLDALYVNSNPLLQKKGRERIMACIEKYAIEVPSVCCDYFVDYPLSSNEWETRINAKGMLVELIDVCPEIGIKLIELPLIGRSSIKDKAQQESTLSFLFSLNDILEKKDMFLLLETDLQPADVKRITDLFPSNRIQINYDTGNSAYWGFDTEYELLNYGEHIGNIHIKDCTPEKYSVNLGEGNVDFDLAFQLFKKMGYKGDFILQAVRGKDDVGIAKTFKEFTEQYLNKYLK